jgi:hypothetical protein
MRSRFGFERALKTAEAARKSDGVLGRRQQAGVVMLW